MTIEQPVSLQQKEAQYLQEKQKNLKGWEVVDIGGEIFKVKKDRIFPAIVNGKEIPLHVNIYHHEASNTQIITHSLGLNNPTHEPTVVRADYGCSCMKYPDSFTIPNHDCRQQKNMMLETLADLNVGTVALISEIVAGANGHGDSIAYDQSTVQFLARQNGDHEPSMHEFYKENGYNPVDKRRHDIVSKAIVDTIGTERLAIPAMDSNRKIQELKDAGLNIVDGLRVNLITNIAEVYDHNLRRDNYAQKPSIQEPGAYLSLHTPDNNIHSIKLNKDTYDLLFRPQVRRVPVLSPKSIN